MRKITVVLVGLLCSVIELYAVKTILRKYME